MTRSKSLFQQAFIIVNEVINRIDNYRMVMPAI